MKVDKWEGRQIFLRSTIFGFLPRPVTMKFSKSVYNKQKLQGVAAIDVPLGFMPPMIANSEYTFVIDNMGHTLFHHLLPKPTTTSRAVVDISTLEPRASREGVISLMKRSV